jgi:hypothetical protein
VFAPGVFLVNGITTRRYTHHALDLVEKLHENFLDRNRLFHLFKSDDAFVARLFV